MTHRSTVGCLMQFILRLIGVWPDCWCNFVQHVVWTIVMVPFQIFQYWYLFAHIGLDPLPSVMMSLSLCVSNSLLYLKLNILWLNKRVIFDIFTRMNEDWSECVSTWSRTQMIRKAVLSHRISKCIVGLYSVAVMLGIVNTLVNMLTHRPEDEQAVKSRNLLIRMNLPFDYTPSPVYEIIIFAQFFLRYTFANTAGMLNTLTATLVLHIGGQIDIMCHELLQIPVARDKRKSRRVALRALVNKHQRIIELTESVESVFCYVSLMQFLSNTLSICFSGFVIVTSLGSTEVLMKIIPYYIIMNMEAFILCFSGEYLNSKSKFISVAAYESLWYELEPTEIKTLMLLLLKSQKQLTITAGKFMELSLESFTSILKASASYISVLHAMY